MKNANNLLFKVGLVGFMLNTLKKINITGRIMPMFYRAIIQWSDARRMALMSVLMAFESLIYLMWALFVVRYANAENYVNLPLIKTLIPFAILSTVGFFVFAWGFMLVPRDSKKHIYLELLLLPAYSVYIVYLGYLVGFDTILTGVSLMGGTVLCLVFVDRLLSYFVLIVNFSISFGMLFLISFHMVAYAPIYAQDYAVLPLFWVASYFYFLAAKVMVIFVAMDMVISALRDSHNTIKHLSEHDVLTGLYNRHSMHLQIELILQDKQGLSLLLLDIDNFKHINDLYGHLVGDDVLKKVAKVLISQVCAKDTVCRFGGEEFLIILPSTTAKEAGALAERVRGELSKHPIEITPQEQALHVQASFGVSSISSVQVKESRLNLNALAHDLIENADKAMYAAKQQGKNRVVVANTALAG